MLKYFTLILFTIFLLLSCGHVDPKAKNTSNSKIETPPAPKKPKRIHTRFDAWVLTDNDSLRKTFKKQFTPLQLHMIWSINRIDATHFKQIDTLLVPDSFGDDLLAFSPFPFQVKVLTGVPKIALFDYAIQAYALYENGYLIKWGPTSMGSKNHPTPTGLFFTNWKGEEVQSTFDDEWILRWNFNVENKAGIGWHQYALPGFPASHSCLRLLEADARWMYTWADEWILKDKETELAKGTPVLVYGQYPFGARKPWMRLQEDPKAIDIKEADLNAYLQPHLEQINREQQNRAEVLVATPPAEPTTNP